MPSTAVTFDVEAVTALPLMTGSLLSVALPPEALPPHAARTVTMLARSAAATVHLPAVVRFAVFDRAFSMCSVPSQIRVLTAQVPSTFVRLAPRLGIALPCKHGVLRTTKDLHKRSRSGLVPASSTACEVRHPSGTRKARHAWSWGDIDSYRLARGATSRVPCQFEPALIVLVCCRPAVGAASAMSSASM